MTDDRAELIADLTDAFIQPGEHIRTLRAWCRLHELTENEIWQAVNNASMIHRPLGEIDYAERQRVVNAIVAQLAGETPHA